MNSYSHLPAWTYFEKAAQKYRKRSHTSFWGIVRRKERERLLALVPPSTKVVLELGSGSGFYSEPLSRDPGRKITCVDFSEAMLNEIPFRCQRVLADLDNLPAQVTQNSYDLILCAGAMEFVKDVAPLVQLAPKLLRPGGAFVFLAPRPTLLGRAYRRFHARHNVSVALFSLGDLRRLAHCAGLQLAQPTSVPPFNWGVELLKI